MRLRSLHCKRPKKVFQGLFKSWNKVLRILSKVLNLTLCKPKSIVSIEKLLGLVPRVNLRTISDS
jgi:hypothetical protein